MSNDESALLRDLIRKCMPLLVAPNGKTIPPRSRICFHFNKTPTTAKDPFTLCFFRTEDSLFISHARKESGRIRDHLLLKENMAIWEKLSIEPSDVSKLSVLHPVVLDFPVIAQQTVTSGPSRPSPDQHAIKLCLQQLTNPKTVMQPTQRQCYKLLVKNTNMKYCFVRSQEDKLLWAAAVSGSQSERLFDKGIVYYYDTGVSVEIVKKLPFLQKSPEMQKTESKQSILLKSAYKRVEDNWQSGSSRRFILSFAESLSERPFWIVKQTVFKVGGFLDRVLK